MRRAVNGDSTTGRSFEAALHSLYFLDGLFVLYLVADEDCVVDATAAVVTGRGGHHAAHWSFGPGTIIYGTARGANGVAVVATAGGRGLASRG